MYAVASHPLAPLTLKLPPVRCTWIHFRCPAAAGAAATAARPIAAAPQTPSPTPAACFPPHPPLYTHPLAAPSLAAQIPEPSPRTERQAASGSLLLQRVSHSFTVLSREAVASSASSCDQQMPHSTRACATLTRCRSVKLGAADAAAGGPCGFASAEGSVPVEAPGAVAAPAAAVVVPAAGDGEEGEEGAGQRSNTEKERSREAEARKRPLWDHDSCVTVRLCACECAGTLMHVRAGAAPVIHVHAGAATLMQVRAGAATWTPWHCQRQTAAVEAEQPLFRC
eukprot:1161623-Pelagomonas_calceolata.AAC.18